MDKNSVSDNLATFTKKAFGVSSSGCDSDTEHFREVTKKMLDLFAAKNADYGNSFRKLYAEMGFPYSYIHMQEKLRRANTLSDREHKVGGESMLDSLYDLANYAVLTIIEIERRICKHCEFLHDDGFPYCIMQDLYTEVGPYEEACSLFLEKSDETSDEEGESCSEFESDKI